MLFTNNLRGRSFAKDPAVVHLGTSYFLYHSIPPLHEGAVPGYGIGIAVSDDMEHWQVVGELPITQDCEARGICAPGAIVLDGVIHLFYQTYGNERRDAICHAVSRDGLHFEKDASNPVFHPTTDWCCGRAIDADVCVFKGKLYLYVATRDHDFRIQKLGGAVAELGSGYGRDAWKALNRQSILHPELLWEGECIEAPALITDASSGEERMYLFYGGSYNCMPQQIGCAVTKDGRYFERLFTLPFLPCGEAGDWNSSESGHPFAFRDTDGRCYLFYQGSPDGGQSWYLSKREFGFDQEGLPRLLW